MYVDSFWEKKQTNKQTNEQTPPNLYIKNALELFHNMGAVRSIVVLLIQIPKIFRVRDRELVILLSQIMRQSKRFLNQLYRTILSICEAKNVMTLFLQFLIFARLLRWFKLFVCIILRVTPSTLNETRRSRTDRDDTDARVRVYTHAHTKSFFSLNSLSFVSPLSRAYCATPPLPLLNPVHL